MNTFDITINGRDYSIDVVEDGKDIEIFIDRADIDDDDTEDEIPDNELLKVTEYLVNEGFVRAPSDDE